MAKETTSDNSLPWLNEYRIQKKNRTMELTMKAVETLLEKGVDVTYANIASITKEIDPSGKGLHPNTIKSNPEAHSYYKQHSSTYKQRERLNYNRYSSNFVSKNYFYEIKLDRNKKDVINRFLKMSKAELAERLFLTEQFIAENNQKWLIEQFLNFENIEEN